MEESFDNQEYNQAFKRVKNIKGFYINLLIYLITNAVMIYINLKYSPDFHWFWYSVLSWGAGLLLYGMKVFGYIPFMSSNWEEKKLMELIAKGEGTANTDDPLSKQIQYDYAKKRVRALRNFYRHLTAYIIVIAIVAILLSVGLQSGQDIFVYIAYGTALGWTIGLIIHIAVVYRTSLFMGKNWEQKKIQELVQKEQHSTNKWE